MAETKDAALAARRVLERFADLIQGLAGDIPPPNPFTPQFYMFADAMRNEGRKIYSDAMDAAHDRIGELFTQPMSEADAISEAAMVFAKHGIEFCLPWNGDLDDLERERYEALVEACHAYAEALR